MPVPVATVLNKHGRGELAELWVLALRARAQIFEVAQGLFEKMVLFGVQVLELWV